MELIDIIPVFNLYEEFWRIYTNNDIIPPQYISDNAKIDRSIIGDGCEIYGEVYNSVIGAGVTVGAGTVINAEQCEAALAAGATFIVSPGLSPAVAKICTERNIPYYPGCVTPTEIMAALEFGITTVKFFPANIYGGLKALKALSAPFPQVKFIPTGGVDRSNIDEFLAFDKIAAIGGSFFVKEALEKMEEER